MNWKGFAIIGNLKQQAKVEPQKKRVVSVKKGYIYISREVIEDLGRPKRATFLYNRDKNQLVIAARKAGDKDNTYSLRAGKSKAGIVVRDFSFLKAGHYNATLHNEKGVKFALVELNGKAGKPEKEPKAHKRKTYKGTHWMQKPENRERVIAQTIKARAARAAQLVTQARGTG